METPRFLSRRPSEATLIPLPIDEVTPPVTKINFDTGSSLGLEPCHWKDRNYNTLFYSGQRVASNTTCISIGRELRVTVSLGCGFIASIPISRQNVVNVEDTSFDAVLG